MTERKPRAFGRRLLGVLCMIFVPVYGAYMIAAALRRRGPPDRNASGRIHPVAGTTDGKVALRAEDQDGIVVRISVGSTILFSSPFLGVATGVLAYLAGFHMPLMGVVAALMGFGVWLTYSVALAGFLQFRASPEGLYRRWLLAEQQIEWKHVSGVWKFPFFHIVRGRNVFEFFVLPGFFFIKNTDEFRAFMAGHVPPDNAVWQVFR